MSTKNTISQQQLNAAIEAYNLQDLVKILPPANYKAHAKKTVRSTIEAVCQDFILTPYLKAILGFLQALLVGLQQLKLQPFLQYPHS